MGLQKNQIEYAQKYGDQVSTTASNYSDLAKKAGNIPTDFAKATAGQAMSDLGISGDGVLTGGLSAGVQYIFQVANMAEAMTAKTNMQNKQSIGLVGR